MVEAYSLWVETVIQEMVLRWKVMYDHKDDLGNQL